MSRFSRIAPFLVLPLLAQSAMAQVVQSQPITQGTNVAPPSQLPPAQSSNDPAPPVPSPVVGRKVEVIRQAGRGGQTAYAREGVLELGGGLSFGSTSDYLTLTVQPFFGFFLTNNFQLSFLANISHSRIGHTNDAKDLIIKPTSVSMLVQPSFHLPITPTFFAYAGLGIGAGYLKASNRSGANHGWGFAFEPELGFNILIGRSGIISPSANVLLTTNRLATNSDSSRAVVSLSNSVGANVRYSFMF